MAEAAIGLLWAFGIAALWVLALFGCEPFAKWAASLFIRTD